MIRMAHVSYTSWLQMLLKKEINDDKQGYLIEMNRNKKKWFFFETNVVDPLGLTDQIVWTGTKNKATIFASEESVEEFKFHFLSPRKCSIIRVTYDMNFLLGG